MKEVYVTQHAMQRIKERSGIGKSKEKIQRAAQKAYEQGLTYNDLKGTFKRYFDRLEVKYKGGVDIRIYNGEIWIFDQLRLVTVKPVPSQYQAKFQIYVNKEKKDEEEI